MPFCLEIGICTIPENCNIKKKTFKKRLKELKTFLIFQKYPKEIVTQGSLIFLIYKQPIYKQLALRM